MKISKIPWPVLDTGFTNILSPETSLGRDGLGLTTVFESLNETEWWVPARTFPEFDPRGSVPRGYDEWVKRNNALIERLSPEGRFAEFPWEVLWTIRAIEAGRALELREEHCRACALGLASIAGVNVTPGYYGAPKVRARILKDGRMVIRVPREMLGRWIGKGGSNIRRMEEAYGYPLSLSGTETP